MLPSLSGEKSNLKPRELGVVFQDLCVQGLGSDASYQPTVGSMLNPFVIPEKIRSMLHPVVRNILTGFEGVVNPGEMLCMYFILSFLLSNEAHSPQWF